MSEILANFQKEGDSIDEVLNSDPQNPEEKETETPSTPPVETKPEEEQAASSPAAAKEETQQNIPFHQHPRWIERENKLNDLLQFKAEAEEKLSKFDESKRTDTVSKIPSWFQKMYGEDGEAWADYQNQELANRASIKAEIIGEIKAEAKAQQETTQYWKSWADNELESLQQDLGVRFDKDRTNKLVKFTTDYLPTDEAGNISIRKAYQLMEQLENADKSMKSNARKEIAASTTSSGGGEKKTQDFHTSASLRNKDWHSIGNEINN